MALIARTATLFRTISRALLFAGGAGLLLAVISTSWLQFAAAIVGGILTLLGAIFTVAGKYVLAPLDMTDLIGDTERGLAPGGLAAEARVLAFRTTAMQINKRYPVVALRLAVSLDGEPPYETGIRAVMQRNSASHFPPGTEVPVRIDPQDHTRVALDASRAPWLQNILM